ncbi:MAG: DNA-binding protein [Candidatus Bathyarchaeia archaeon]
MSDLELEMIRYKKMMELKRQIEKKKTESERTKEINPREILDKFFVDRAWEVFNAAKSQYPEIAAYIERSLVKLISEGKIRDKISGEDLYGLFLRLGYRVRLPTRINVVEDGKVKSLEQKIKEDISGQ